MIAYRAMLDVPRELVMELAKLLRAERRDRGTRKGTRLLTCFRQALLVLVWMRTKGDVAVVGTGFKVSRATAYRYRDEGIRVLAARGPDLHEALQRGGRAGLVARRARRQADPHRPLRRDHHERQGRDDQRLVLRQAPRTRRKHPSRHPPRRPPIFVSDVAPGHLHDLTVARDAGVIAALNWAAAQLDLPTLADSGYDGAGQGIKTPIKQPADGQSLAPDNQAYNTLLRATRCLGERGFALLIGRWRALQRVTVSPRRIGELAQAALVLTRIENVQLRRSC